MTNKTIRFTKKSILYTILGFVQSHSGPLGDIDGYSQMFPRTYKKDRSIDITAIDNIHLKSDCIDGSFVNGVRQPNF